MRQLQRVTERVGERVRQTMATTPYPKPAQRRPRLEEAKRLLREHRARQQLRENPPQTHHLLQDVHVLFEIIQSILDDLDEE